MNFRTATTILVGIACVGAFLLLKHTNATTAVTKPQMESTTSVVTRSEPDKNSGQSLSFAAAEQVAPAHVQNYNVADNSNDKALAKYFSTLDDETLLKLTEYEAHAALELAKRELQSPHSKAGIGDMGQEKLLLAIALDPGLTETALALMSPNIDEHSRIEVRTKAYAVDLLRHRLGLDLRLLESPITLVEATSVNVETAQIIADTWYYKLAHYRARVANDRSWLEGL